MKEELKPCPFCGREVQAEENSTLLNGHRYWQIKHGGCSFVKEHSSLYTTKEKLTEAWNQRKPTYDEITEMVEREG